LVHVIAAKAVSFKEALTPEFRSYQRQVVINARVLGEHLTQAGFRLVSGGTDNHLLLVDLSSKKITGKEAEEALEKAGLTANKNAVPFDTQPRFVTGGIRVGTPAVTTRGLKEAEMRQVAEWIDRSVNNRQDDLALAAIRAEVKELCQRFPIYPELQRTMV
jgi:glycine hydroxymethyltransferase